jgi:hypothetical protein
MSVMLITSHHITKPHSQPCNNESATTRQGQNTSRLSNIKTPECVQTAGAGVQAHKDRMIAQGQT